jgi:hypothetical protein
MTIKSMGFIAAAAAVAVSSPALAQITPGTLTPSLTEGSFSLFAGGFVGGLPASNSEFHNYSAPVVYADTITGGGGTATGGISIISAPVPALLSSATLNGGPNVAGNASATIRGSANYSFQILGALPTATVHVDALGEVGFGAFTGANNSGSVTAQFRLAAANNGPLVIDQFLSFSNFGGVLVNGDFPQDVSPVSTIGFSYNSNFTLLTNTVYDVILRTTLTGTANGPTTESMFANIDPMFTVDGPFTLQVSPGFGGVTLADTGGGGGGVPEPDSWAILILGFAGVGGVLRRRRAIPA